MAENLPGLSSLGRNCTICRTYSIPGLVIVESTLYRMWCGSFLTPRSIIVICWFWSFPGLVVSSWTMCFTAYHIERVDVIIAITAYNWQFRVKIYSLEVDLRLWWPYLDWVASDEGVASIWTWLNILVLSARLSIPSTPIEETRKRPDYVIWHFTSLKSGIESKLWRRYWNLACKCGSGVMYRMGHFRLSASQLFFENSLGHFLWRELVEVKHKRF